MNELKTKSILMGGVLATIIGVIPFVNFINCFCCAGYILGGYYSVYYYNRHTTEITTQADAALIGVLTGLFTALFSMVWDLFMVQVFGVNPTVELLLGWMEQTVSEMNDPELTTQYDELMNILSNQTISFISILQNTIINGLVFGLFSMIGGLIRSSQDQKNNPQQPGIIT